MQKHSRICYARDGAGNFSLPYPDFVSGTTIESAQVDANNSDIEDAITASIAKDGQTVPTANLPMGGFKHTGVAVASARTDYARADQVIGSVLDYAADTGTATAYAIAPSPGISAYVVGQRFAFKATLANSGADPTLAVNSLPAGIIYWPNAASLVAGEIPANALVEVIVATVTTGTPTFHLQSATKPMLARTGGTLTGATTASATFNMSGAAFNEAHGADIASATTTDIGAATGNFVKVTGTTTITGLGTVQAGTRRVVEFTGILTLTHNGTSLILPTAANITTAAGDVATFSSLGSGNWKCVGYLRASGAPILAPQQYAQAYCTVSGGTLTTQKSTGFTSVVRDSTGLFTCTLSTAMPDTNYVVEFTIGSTSGITLNRYGGEDLSTARTTTVFHLYVNGDGAGSQDPASLNIRVYA
jgi:hypothetical protein